MFLKRLQNTCSTEQTKFNMSGLSQNWKDVGLKRENIPFSFISIHRITLSAAGYKILFTADANSYKCNWIFTSSFSILKQHSDHTEGP